MIRQDILKRINSYLVDVASLQSLQDLSDKYDWEEESRTSQLEWEVMGTISLYAHEIAEGLRNEADLKVALEQFQLDPTVVMYEQLPIHLSDSQAIIITTGTPSESMERAERLSTEPLTNTTLIQERVS